MVVLTLLAVAETVAAVKDPTVPMLKRELLSETEATVH